MNRITILNARQQNIRPKFSIKKLWLPSVIREQFSNHTINTKSTCTVDKDFLHGSCLYDIILTSTY